MNYAARLADGLFVKTYSICQPGFIRIERCSSPKYYQEPEALRLKELIENFSKESVTLLTKNNMKKPRSKKGNRRITAALGIERQLKEEGEKNPLNIEKIDQLRKELERLNQKLDK